MQSQAKIRYAAELAQVREISLLGTADLGYWQDALRDENVSLAERDGRAQVLIIAAAAEYWGIRFREVSISLLVDGFGGRRMAGAFLWQAFSSQRFFAFCERSFFRTPYAHADVWLNCWPALVQVRHKSQTILRVKNASGHELQSREPLRVGKEGWGGPVLLPSRRDADKDGRLFFAKISGETRVYPYLDSDSLELKPSEECDITRRLIDSGFIGREWIVREDAMHRKSKTYARRFALEQGALPI